MAQLVKTVNQLAIASCKTVQGLAIASVKTINGLDNTAGGSYASQVLAYSPIGYWKLDESSGTTAADSSGNGRDGTYTGGYTLGVTGPANTGGTATGFNGTSSYVTMTNNAAYNVGNCTMIAWVYSTAAQARWVFARDINTGRSFAFGTDNTGAKNQVFLQIAGSGLSVSGNDDFPVTTWSMIAATYDGTDWRQYANGSLISTQAGSAVGSVTAALTIGRRDYPGNEDYWDGRIAHVALIGSQLTTGQILTLYNAGV